MIKIKSFILDETNWLEVIWVNENDEQIHCESFSGHPEHIAMLRARALEFGTKLDESLIKECIANFKYPTEEELAQQELESKIAEAKAYLESTDFKMTVDYYSTLTADEQAELTEKRAEAREYVRVNDVSNS